MVTRHGEACDHVLGAVRAHDCDEVLVRLVRLAWWGYEALFAASCGATALLLAGTRSMWTAP